MMGSDVPPGGPYRSRPPTPGVTVGARVLAFVTLALVALWAVFLAGVSSLTIMWGPPCVNGPGCGPTFWSAVGVALVGCAVTFVILVLALPLAWRRPSLIVWTVAALGVSVCTAVWAVANVRL